MKVKQTTVLSTVTASAGVATNEAAFLPGMTVPAMIHAPTAGGSALNAVIQTSEDNSTWATATGATAITTPGTHIQNITLKQYVRLNVTAITGGSAQLSVFGNVG